MRNESGRVAERALLVSVHFSSRKAQGGRTTPLTASARLARDASRISSTGPGEDLPVIPQTRTMRAEEDQQAAMTEFRDLALSAGAELAGEVLQRRDRPDPATLIGPGKMDEVAAMAESTDADLILFDHDLSPSQLRNLESALPWRIIDRTQLILDIFAAHARTREGQLQVEMAQLEYMLPRLAGAGRSMSQTGGGIGTRGPGETKLETDRRKIRRRIEQVARSLESVRRIRHQQRQRRQAVPVPAVALVGYTNAGKSTLFNAITAAGVLESPRLFATLDPKLAAIQLPSRRKVLLSDTVGFIRNLPHTLVTSFRATLEEVERSEVLLHVRDASSPLMDEQKAEVEKVLAELDVRDTPRVEVWNKIDLLPDDQRNALLARTDIVAVSARQGIGLERLLARIDESLTSDPVAEGVFAIPQSEGRILSALDAGAVVLEKRFAGEIVYLAVRGPGSLLERYGKYRVNS